MGIIRGFFLVIVAVLLFFSIFAVNLFWILSSSLTYENVQRESAVVIKDVLQDLNVTSIISERFPVIQSFCQNNSEYVFSEEGYVFDISCESVLQGENAVVDDGVRSLIDNIYYKNYSENVSDYLHEPQVPTFIISEKAYNFSNKIFYYSLILSFILVVLLFLLVEKKSNTFLLPGIFIVVSSLLFIKIDSLLSLFSEGIVFKILGVFFSESFYISLKLLIAGILLIILAIVFKVFKLGFWISSVVEKIKGKMKKSSSISEEKPKTKNK